MKSYLFICLSVLFLSPVTVFGQIEMNSLGSVGIGITPNSTQEVTIKANAKYIGLKVTSETHSTTRFASQSFAIGGTYTYGLWAKGYSGSYKNYGVYADAYGGSYNYAVYAKNSTTTGTRYAGYFAGNVYVSGTFTNPSDRRLKEDIRSLDKGDVLSKLMKLRPVSYNYRRAGEYRDMNLREGRQYGLLAQEVESVFPEFVSEHVHPGSIDENGIAQEDEITYKGMSYVDLIPLLITAIQEQQAEIEALKAALAGNR